MDRLSAIHQNIIESRGFGLGSDGLFVRVLNEFARWNDHVTFEYGEKLDFQENVNELKVIFPLNPSKADLFEIAKRISVDTGRDERLKIGKRWSNIGRFLLENADSAMVIFKKKIDDPTKNPLSKAKGVRYEESERRVYTGKVRDIGIAFLDLAEELGIARNDTKLTETENREIGRILLGKSPKIETKHDSKVEKSTIRRYIDKLLLYIPFPNKREKVETKQNVLAIVLQRLIGANIRDLKHQKLVDTYSTKFEGRSLGELQRPEKEVLRAIFGRGKEFLRKKLTVRAIGLDNDELISDHLKINEYKSRIEAASSESEKDSIKLEFVRSLYGVVRQIQYDDDDFESGNNYRSFSVKGILYRNMTQCQGYSLVAETYCEMLDIKYVAMSIPKHSTGIVNIGDKFYISDLGHSFGIVDVSDSLSEKDKSSIRGNVVGEVYSLENTMWVKPFYSHLIDYPDGGYIPLSIGVTDSILSANLATIGSIFQNEEEYRLAQLCYRYTIALRPDDPIGYYLLDILYLQLKNDKKREEYIVRATNLDTWNLYQLSGLAYIQHRMGKDNDSKNTYLQILDKDPNYAEAYYGLGTAYFGLKQYKESKEYYEEFLSRVNSEPDLQNRFVDKQYFVDIVEHSKSQIIECNNFLQKT